MPSSEIIDLSSKYKIKLERLVNGNHSSLLCNRVSDEEKSFIIMATGCQDQKPVLHQKQGVAESHTGNTPTSTHPHTHTTTQPHNHTTTQPHNHTTT
jgi:hypothetical protein